MDIADNIINNAAACQYTVLAFPKLAIYSYLIGSIPFGLVLSWAFGYGDIRKIGSGNIGATNVLRSGNKFLALITLILDSSKGAAFLLYMKLSGGCLAGIEPAFFCFFGFFAILGHCFPIWLKFKGGKGVATALGVLLVAVPYAGLSACATWLLIASIFKYSSLAALAAVAVAPVVTLLVYGAHPAGVCALIALLVWARHAANIKRLLKGEEPKIRAKKMEAANHREDAQTPSEL